MEERMRILVPVDGSTYSQAAVDFLKTRNTLIGADPQVELLNVQTPVPVRAARVVGKAIVQGYYDDEAAKALKPALAALAKAGLTAQTRVRVGHPADEIATAAERGKADLVVIGSHGHGAFMSALLGSVTQGVLARTRKPLLVLRARQAPKSDSLAVGIAVDGSKYGKAAVKYVLQHRALFGPAPRVSLLHVVPDFAGAVMPDMAGIALPAFSSEDVVRMQADAFEAAVKPVRALLARAALPAEEVKLVGPAGDEIAAFARKRKLDVLVLGSHGRGAFKNVVMGSVATRVAALSKTPLLLIRET